MNIFITGAGSGIGHATAKRLIEQGHSVIGVDIAPFVLEGAKSLICDVTDEEGMKLIVEKLHADGVTFDAIINAAGIHAMCSLVEGDYAKMKRLIEINLCGVMLINKLLHPLLTKKGRIIIITSEVAPLDPMPFNGLYNVSKTALDSYAQALRQELNLIGQKVITVRPGAIETPLAKGSLDKTKALANNTQLYEKQAKHFLTITKRFMGTPMKPEALAELICRAAVAKRPRLIYSKHRNPGLVLLGVLPKRIQCFVIKTLLNRR